MPSPTAPRLPAQPAAPETLQGPLRSTVPIHYAPRSTGWLSILPTACGVPIKLNKNGDVRKGQPPYMGGGRERYVSCPLCRREMLERGDLTPEQFAERPLVWDDSRQPWRREA
jgi:hypothetical protein